MNQNYMMTFYGLQALQILLALGVVLLAAWQSRRKPGAFYVRLLTQSHRWWFVVGLFLVSSLTSKVAIMWCMRILQSLGLPAVMCVNYLALPWIQVGIRLFIAAVCGVAGCFAAAELDSEGGLRFRFGRGIGVALALSLYFTVVPMWLPWVGFLTPILPVLVIFTYQLATWRRARPEAHAEPDSLAGMDPMHSVIVGLIPTFLALCAFGMAKSSGIGLLLVVACLVSIVCCFGAGFMLFRRRTVPAIIAGIVFMLLNAALSIGFGCGAVLSQMSF